MNKTTRLHHSFILYMIKDAKQRNGGFTLCTNSSIKYI